MGFPGSSVVKNPPAMQDMHFQCMGWEDSLEKEMAIHSSILPWRILWTEEPGGLQSMGLQSQIAKTVLYIVWLLTPCQKYYLQIVPPIHRMPFQPIDCVFWCTKVFKIIPFFYYCFCCLCFWHLIQKIIAKSKVTKFCFYVFLLVVL